MESCTFGYVVGEDDLSFDTRDSAPFVPKGRYCTFSKSNLSHLQERPLLKV